MSLIFGHKPIVNFLKIDKSSFLTWASTSGRSSVSQRTYRRTDTVICRGCASQLRNNSGVDTILVLEVWSRVCVSISNSRPTTSNVNQIIFCNFPRTKHEEYFVFCHFTLYGLCQRVTGDITKKELFEAASVLERTVQLFFICFFSCFSTTAERGNMYCK